MVFDECRLARERVNGVIVTQALLTQLAIASVLDKRSAAKFKETIKSLSEGEQ